MTTKRQVFYSFHYKPDCWRVSTVRNMGTIEGNKSAPDNDWETNTKEALKLVFAHIFEDQLHTMVESNFDIYKKIVENAEFGNFIKEKMFEEVYTKLK